MASIIELYRDKEFFTKATLEDIKNLNLICPNVSDEVSIGDAISKSEGEFEGKPRFVPVLICDTSDCFRVWGKWAEDKGY